MREEDRQSRPWHIHLGAHKTASTHIQYALEGRKSELMAKGTYYLPLDVAREALRFDDVHRPLRLRVLDRLFGSLDKSLVFRSKAFSIACASSLRALVDRKAGSAKRIVVSEENLLGTTDQVFVGSYFQGNRRLSVIRHLASETPVQLFMAVRSLDEFFPSAYAQALRTTPADRLGFVRGLEEMSSNPPSWTVLLKNIQRRVPNAPITVWDYSSYRANSQSIQNMISGNECEHSKMLGVPSRTKSPSAKAIQLAESVSQKDWRKRLEVVNDIYATYPSSNDEPSFQPLNRLTILRLRKAYADDLNCISGLSNVNFVRF